MARKRVSVKSNTTADKIRVRNRNPKQYGYTEPSEVSGLIEATRFAQEQGQGDFIPLTYDPTHTSWPENGWDHRRTTAAGYDRNKKILRVEFYTDGAVYDYGTVTPVPPLVAYAFRKSASPGVFINEVLEGYGYRRVNV